MTISLYNRIHNIIGLLIRDYQLDFSQIDVDEIIEDIIKDLENDDNISEVELIFVVRNYFNLPIFQ
jgi:hypothetical protein